MKKIYYMLLAALSMSMVSCDGWDSPYYVQDIVGSWVSYYGHDGYGEYDILGYDQVRFDFYGNYTGRYTYYSYYGLDYVDFDWETFGDRLVIYYYDGTREYLYYGYDRNGDLILSTDSHFYQYTAYRPGGAFYEPAKEDMADKTKVAKSLEANKTKVNSVSRAIKARGEDMK